MPGIIDNTLRRLGLRRWIAGQSGDRWPRQTTTEKETDTPINQALREQQSVIRTKAINEAANHAIVEGTIGSHQEDWIGPSGPTLRVFSSNQTYNEAAQKCWEDWFRSPCVDPRISGPSLLKMWVRRLWDSGEFFAQRVTRNQVGGGVSMRLKPIHPRRIDTPVSEASNANVINGIRVNADNVPEMYFVAPPSDAFGASILDYKPIAAKYMIHEFVMIEEDQLRGVPFLTPALPAITDMREYDAHVVEAADSAAKMTVVWRATHAEAPYVDVDNTSNGAVARGSHVMGPPGWEPMQISAQQPGANYIEHRKERQAEIGRPVGMPLLAVRQDASAHNYSSARYDSLGYYRRVLGYQIWLGGTTASRGILYDLANEVLLEAAPTLPYRPKDVRYEFRWPKPPHIDEEKAAKAERIAIETGTLTYTDALDARNKTLAETIEQRKTEAKMLAEAGLPALPVPQSTVLNQENDDDGKDAWDKADEQDKTPADAKAKDDEKQKSTKETKK